MKLPFPSPPRSSAGIALMVVMIAVTVLSLLAAAFAYAMKVETKLAQNTSSETELIWLGRSGVEYARWILAQQLAIGTEPYTGLNQKWAGGPGGIGTSNSVLASLSLQEEYHLGEGKFRITIKDLERYANLHTADQATLEKAMRLVGVDAGEAAGIAAAIVDWIDTDENTVGGAESSYYQSLDPPYYAKNRPVDDLTELLLVRGVTPEIYWGRLATNHAPGVFQSRLGRFSPGLPSAPPAAGAGLQEIFTPLSNGKININTASATVLQMIPFVDEVIAAKIIELRAGPDGAEGTEDDMPAGAPGIRIEDVLRSAGLPMPAVPIAARVCTQQSSTFEVEVTAELSGYTRKFHALLGRNSPRDVPVLSFYWTE
jgi:general secretion pathway protein K